MLCNLHKAVFEVPLQAAPRAEIAKRPQSWSIHGAEWQPDNTYDTHGAMPHYLEFYRKAQRLILIPKDPLATVSIPHQYRLSLELDVKPRLHSLLDHGAVL